VRGATAGRRFHLQLTASTSAGGSDALLYQMIPDLDMLDEQLANVDPAWVTLTVRGIGEMAPDTGTPAPNAVGSWMDLSPYEVDEYVVPRAYVHLQLRPGDLATWTAMDRTAQELAMAIAGAPQDIEYLYDGGWQTQPYPLQRAFPGWHWGLGTTYHEAGTLWMGAGPADSVTTELGRLHHVQNLYACDQSLFPTVASVNPVLTGTTLARRLARLLP
jgi:choline dehydrogenase-like flavoprotein